MLIYDLINQGIKSINTCQIDIPLCKTGFKSDTADENLIKMDLLC